VNGSSWVSSRKETRSKLVVPIFGLANGSR